MLSVGRQNMRKKRRQSDDYTQPSNQVVLERFPYTGHQFHFIEVPTMNITPDFFTDPFRVIDDLYSKNYQKIGIVKFILTSTVPEDAFFEKLRRKLAGKRLDTRTQTLNSLRSGQVSSVSQRKPFGSKPAGYTLDEYIRLANQFQQNYKLQGSREHSNTLKQQEIEFWSIVDHPDSYEEVEVEYAADLLATKYATGYDDDQIGNLNCMNKNPDSIFQVLSEKTEMSGLSVPWLYLGMKYSNFCWHCEDLNLNSMNYMHAGAPKTWQFKLGRYAIPPPHARKFRDYFRKTYSEELKSNPRLLYDIVCQISPVELASNGIQVLRTDQKPGELILTLGETFHSGFSHGLNCSEAVNIAPVNWLDEYDKAIEEYRTVGNVKKVAINKKIKVSFPLEWILVRIASAADSLKFSKKNWAKMAAKFNSLILTEITKRAELKKTQADVKEIEYINKAEKYDRNVCKICQNYMYLSYIYCNKCLKKGCTPHISICACENPKITLYLRFNNQELKDLHETLLRKSQ